MGLVGICDGQGHYVSRVAKARTSRNQGYLRSKELDARNVKKDDKNLKVLEFGREKGWRFKRFQGPDFEGFTD